MKKILVLSDSHGKFNKILNIFETEKPDITIYVGDGIGDIEDLSYVHKSEYYIVNGNCDFFEKNYGHTKFLEVEGKKILMTHGHVYGVKRGLEELRKLLKETNSDIAIYGHTHKEYLENYEGSYLFNPGASEDGKYGLILIENNKIEFLHKRI